MKNLPTSGSERKFTNRRWGTATGKGNNNCYAYAVGDYEAYRWQKSIPGDRSGLSNKPNDYTTCTGLPNGHTHTSQTPRQGGARGSG